MKKVYVFLFLSLFFSVAAAQNSTTGNVNVLLGNKTLDSADWAPWDSQGEFGILIDVAGPTWPVAIAIDLLGSADEHLGITVSTSELDLGVRKVFDLTGSSLHPYLGGGLALITARIQDDWFGGEIHDDGTGIWLSGGFFVTLGESFNLGLELRHSAANVDFGTPYSADAGGSHAGVLLGYHW